ncbi:MAG: cytochrome c [Alphaproteobacteria bacterium]
MKSKFLFTIAAGVIVGGIVVATGSSAGPAESVKYRQNLMKANGAHMGDISMLVKGEVAFGAPHVVAQAEGLEASAKLVADSFKDKTGDTGPTAAKANIWTDWQGFQEKAKALETESAKLVAVAKKGDMNAIGEQVKAVGAACGGCHETFREKKS